MTNDNFTARSPDYQLKARDKHSKAQTVVGRGWSNEDGSLSIQLNPCVTLSWRDEIFITAFPIDPKRAEDR